MIDGTDVFDAYDGVDLLCVRHFLLGLFAKCPNVRVLVASTHAVSGANVGNVGNVEEQVKVRFVFCCSLLLRSIIFFGWLTKNNHSYPDLL